jgi:hypothetical protein
LLIFDISHKSEVQKYFLFFSCHSSFIVSFVFISTGAGAEGVGGFGLQEAEGGVAGVGA